MLSLFGPRVDRAQTTPALIEGIPHFLSRRAAVLLARLAATYDCVWCTGWEDRADGHLPHLLGLPAGWPHIVFPDRPQDAAHWKLRRDRRARGPGPPRRLDRRRPRRALPRLGAASVPARPCS